MSATLTHTAHESGALVIAIQGRLDTTGAQQTEGAFAEAISGHDGPVVVDLSGVDYISSSGIAMLVVKGRTLRERGAVFLVVATSPRVLEVFALVGFQSFFPLYETLEAALAAVA